MSSPSRSTKPEVKSPALASANATLPYRIVRMAMMCFLRCWQLTAAYHGLDQLEAVQLGEEIDELPQP